MFSLDEETKVGEVELPVQGPLKVASQSMNCYTLLDVPGIEDTRNLLILEEFSFVPKTQFLPLMRASGEVKER